ncbi:MAG: S8 family serine peptidase [Gammaproteobacteria bacterium]|nr:S8 family serine peptidase [Gammaproteobacteria bacterium]
MHPIFHVVFHARQKHLLAIFSLITLLAYSLAAASSNSKIAPWVQQQLASSGSSEAILRMQAGTDLGDIDRAAPRLQRLQQITELLQATAASSQSAVRQYLRDHNIEHRSYWINNSIWLRADAATLQALSQRDDIAYVHANPGVAGDFPARQDSQPLIPLGSIEPSISLVGAPLVWAAGHTGEGIVIGGQDTGYEWDHPALINSYRGWNGIAADHNYHWHDAIHTGGSDCGADSTEPCDDNNHGTHTMGTMVGDDGGSNQIGMAPGAKWIACRNMDEGNGTPATYTECFQWFMAPTDLAGNNPDPAMAPHIINNSWGCPPSEGCTDPTIMQTVVENVRAAGIVVVVSAGNSGSSCGSVSSPAAIYDAAFTVANTTINDSIAGSSSRGPVTVDGSNRMKPDISAPGTSIRSSIRNGGYASFSGTSMAGPHVAGHLALLLSANPGLIGQVDYLENLTRNTALQLTSTQDCGGTAGLVPNNVFGAGRIQSDVALDGLLQEVIRSDGFEQAGAL